MWKVDYSVIYSSGVLRTKNGNSHKLSTLEVAWLWEVALKYNPLTRRLEQQKRLVIFF